MRWRLKLNKYNYEIIYKPGSANRNADALSRNPQILAITDSPLSRSVEIIEPASLEEDLNPPSPTSTQFETIDGHSEEHQSLSSPVAQEILNSEENPIPCLSPIPVDAPTNQSSSPVDDSDTDKQNTEPDSYDDDEKAMYQHFTQAKITTVRNQLSIQKDNIVIVTS